MPLRTRGEGEGGIDAGDIGRHARTRTDRALWALWGATSARCAPRRAPMNRLAAVGALGALWLSGCFQSAAAPGEAAQLSCELAADCIGPCADAAGISAAPTCVHGLCLCVLPADTGPSRPPDGQVAAADDATAGDDGPSPPPDAMADGQVGDALAAPDGLTPSDAGDATAPSCPAQMVAITAAGLSPFCIDRYEAPGAALAQPLVMYTYTESLAWCAHRGKRLCFDDEWTAACAGPAGHKYPYGDTHKPGTCNDDMSWKAYSQDKLNGWPWSASTPQIGSLTELLSKTSAISNWGKTAADHVQELYQATPAGSKAGCGGAWGVYDLQGNVEEWTTRRDGGKASFHGNLKGRYWAEPRTCQSQVTTHGDGFRFYEIGFRCCQDL